MKIQRQLGKPSRPVEIPMRTFKSRRGAVACPQWKWSEAMLAFDPKEPEIRLRADYCSPEELATMLPDLTDPATMGCLLGLVRSAWGSTAHLVRLNTNTINGPACWWAIALGLSSTPFLYRHRCRDLGAYLAAPTEAGACVAALAAKKKK